MLSLVTLIPSCISAGGCPCGVSGALSQGEVSGVIRGQHNAIRHCYEKVLQKQPNAAGKVSVKFVIGASGKVLTAHIVQDTIRSRELGECIIARIKTWNFPKPAGGQKVTITYPWVFGGASGVSGGLSQGEVSGVIRGQHNAIRHCYEKVLQKQPNAAGKMSVKFVIGASGKVLTVKIVQDTIRSNELGGCIIANIKTWKFPKPAGGQKVTITYPWVFKKHQ